MGVISVNFELVASFNQRSLDAIKSVRCTSAYIAIHDKLSGHVPDPPRPTKLLVLNQTTPWLDFRQHEQAEEMVPETLPETQGTGTQIGMESFPQRKDESYATLWETALVKGTTRQPHRLVKSFSSLLEPSCSH